jgi:hypothetical protein
LVDATDGRYRKDVTVTDPADRHDIPTVLVSVTPQLLSDAIERLLSTVPCRIVLPDATNTASPRHVTVAVVNGDLPGAVDADLVIRVSAEPQVGSVTSGIGSVPELVAEVARAVGRREPA